MKKAKSYAEDWEHNDKRFPTRRGTCDHCGTKGDTKLSFDQIHYICIDAKICINRWKRQHEKGVE